jgi:NAD(P)-dependent dehydrogenase (short-subunit alcohol dehydrogenase family)
MTSLTNIPISQIKGIETLKVLAIGGTGGLGRSISQVLASKGAKVTAVGRTFRDEKTENIDFIKADLSSIASSQQLASSLDASDFDIVLFTTGIFSSRSREETSEGFEKDLAVSFLNRLAILDIIGDKLSHNSVLGSPRVFVMGFPGNGQLGTPDDLNQEKKYSFFTAHMNTVAGNECLVLNSAQKYSNFRVFGMNPGLVKTNIRDNLLGTGIFSRILETAMGWFTPTPEQYAQKVVPAMLSPQLNELNGVHIDKKGNLLDGSKGLTQEYANEYIAKCEELLRSKGF